MHIVIAIGLAVGLDIGLGALLALPVMWLWNWLMPELFGVKDVTWIQAWGLLVLCGVLFKPSVGTSKS